MFFLYPLLPEEGCHAGVTGWWEPAGGGWL